MMSSSRLMRNAWVFGACGALLLVGCFGDGDEGSNKKDDSAKGGASTAVEHPEGDPSVSAEDGGPGFTGEGWETSTPVAIGDPAAVKGGMIKASIPAWPDNLRMYGIRSNTHLNYLVRDLCYEVLLDISPQTLEFTPRLATHWKISDDKMRFTFRLDPRAHWSDGKPVVADDVVATWDLIMDDSLKAPMSKDSFSHFKRPKRLSKYMVEVECKDRQWLHFIMFANSLLILPAHEIADLSGEEYLEKYNFKYTAVSGPYIVNPEDIETDRSLTMTRRKDYWARDDKQHTGQYNFDKIHFTVILDHHLAFEKACKGELDFHAVHTAQWWVEDLTPLDAVKKGHLIRRKVFTKYPKAFQGQAFNMRKPPLDDVRVRKALAHLYDRKTMLEKFAFNEYVPLKSYYPGGTGENLDNKLVEFDPREAVRLLGEAGWTKRGDDGILVKDGKKLSFPLTYASKVFEKYLTVYKEDCRKAGVEMELQLIDPETRWNNVQDRSFTISGASWGAMLYPNPRTFFHGSLADKKGANNYVGFKSEIADAIIDEYDQEFDAEKRAELIRQLDAEIFRNHPYMLDWGAPYERFIYWNKFGMPKTVLFKYDEWEDAFRNWWIDPVKLKALNRARKADTSLPIPKMELKPWDDQEVARAAQ